MKKQEYDISKIEPHEDRLLGRRKDYRENLVYREKQYEDKKYNLEKELQAYILKRLKAVEKVYAVKISDKFSKGIPDLLLCVNSKFLAIELKVKNNTTSTLQDENLANIELAMGIGVVCRTWGEVKEVIRDIYPEVDFKFHSEVITTKK